MSGRIKRSGSSDDLKSSSSNNRHRTRDVTKQIRGYHDMIKGSRKRVSMHLLTCLTRHTYSLMRLRTHLRRELGVGDRRRDMWQVIQCKINSAPEQGYRNFRQTLYARAFAIGLSFHNHLHKLRQPSATASTEAFANRSSSHILSLSLALPQHA